MIYIYLYMEWYHLVRHLHSQRYASRTRKRELSPHSSNEHLYSYVVCTTWMLWYYHWILSYRSISRPVFLCVSVCVWEKELFVIVCAYQQHSNRVNLYSYSSLCGEHRAQEIFFNRVKACFAVSIYYIVYTLSEQNFFLHSCVRSFLSAIKIFFIFSRLYNILWASPHSD